MSSKKDYSGAIDFLTQSCDPDCVYDRIGLLAETIGWTDVIELYRHTGDTIIRQIIEKFIVRQVIMGTNQELMRVLLSVNQLDYVRLFMKIRSETQFPDSLSRLLSPLADDVTMSFWENSAICWLVRESQIAQVEVMSCESVIKRSADLIKRMLTLTSSDIISIIGYEIPVISQSSSSALLPFCNLNRLATISTKVLFEQNPQKNLVIIISESIYRAFGTDDLTKLFTGAEGIILIIELATESIQPDVYTKYGLDTYHIRTTDPMILEIIFNDPDTFFKNIYRF